MGNTTNRPLGRFAAQGQRDAVSREQIQQLEQHIQVLETHLGILRSLSTQAKVLEVVEQTLDEAKEQLRKITSP